MHHNQYTEKKRIYSGPHSDVYSAQTESGLVCLKVVDADISQKPHDIRREISLVKQLDHKAIVPLLDEFEWIDDIYMVMPLYKYTLNELLSSKYCKRSYKHDLVNPMNPPTVQHRNTATEPQILSMLTNLVDGLKYIHSQGIIHRDIKPSNIFFASEDLSQCIIGDFGISYNIYDTKQKLEEPLECKFTDVCSGIYKPIELCFGKCNYSYELDVWSLGVMMTYVCSRNLRSIVDTESQDEAVLNDLVLINSIFDVLGTPHTQSTGTDDDRLYWPEMDNDKYHFNKMKFLPRCTKPLSQVFPIIKSEAILDLLGEMLIYEASRRISSSKLHEKLIRISTS